MSTRASSFAARARRFSRKLWALPAFVILTLIPWLLAANAFVLSRQFYDVGKDLPGVALDIAAVALAGLTAFSMAWFLVLWLMMLVRCIRGAENEDVTPDVDPFSRSGHALPADKPSGGG